MTGGVVREYADKLRWDLLPVYIGLAGISVWLGMVTVAFMTVNVPEMETATLARLSMLLGVLFGVVFPFGPPAAAVAGQWWRGEL